MSEARHITPGPWVAAHVDSQKLPIFPDAKHPKPIRIHSGAGAVADVFYEPDDAAEATMRANARLIAAALDLLRALASLADLASCVEQPEDAAIAEEFDRACRNAAQAIARATLPLGGAAYECRADHKGRA